MQSDNSGKDLGSVGPTLQRISEAPPAAKPLEQLKHFLMPDNPLVTVIALRNSLGNKSSTNLATSPRGQTSMSWADPQGQANELWQLWIKNCHDICDKNGDPCHLVHNCIWS